MAREIKIATYNAEWMVNLFKNGKPELLDKHTKTSPGLGAKPKFPQVVAGRIASVIRDLNADIVGICEGPPLKSQMQAFVNEKLSGEYFVYTMEDGAQSVHVLVRQRLARGLKISQLSAGDAVFTRLRATRNFFKFGNVTLPHRARFTRLPVILRLERKGKITEIMAVHTKSKISELKKASDWETKSPEKIISAINSRQKLSIEMNVIRKYIAHRLYSGSAESVIVMGDLNDGIARDIIDDTYLLHSIVHELRGAFHHDIALMRHALSPKQLQRKGYAWTVEFRDATNGGRKTRVLLDHILYSPRCHDGGKICFVPESGCVERDVYARHVNRKGESRDDRPSDHIPLSARFILN